MGAEGSEGQNVPPTQTGGLPSGVGSVGRSVRIRVSGTVLCQPVSFLVYDPGKSLFLLPDQVRLLPSYPSSTRSITEQYPTEVPVSGDVLNVLVFSPVLQRSTSGPSSLLQSCLPVLWGPVYPSSLPSCGVPYTSFLYPNTEGENHCNFTVVVPRQRVLKPGPKKTGVCGVLR